MQSKSSVWLPATADGRNLIWRQLWQYQAI
jgi:hypothetical protein